MSCIVISGEQQSMGSLVVLLLDGLSFSHDKEGKVFSRNLEKEKCVEVRVFGEDKDEIIIFESGRPEILRNWVEFVGNAECLFWIGDQEFSMSQSQYGRVLYFFLPSFTVLLVPTD